MSTLTDASAVPADAMMASYGDMIEKQIVKLSVNQNSLPSGASGLKNKA